MPALAPQPETQFMVVMGAGRLYGDAGRKLLEEANRAVRRVGNVLGWSYDPAAGSMGLRQSILDPVSSLDDLRQFATTQGVNFDALVVEAAQHFTSPVLKRRTDPLSNAEMESLFEDDQRHLGELLPEMEG